MSGIGNATGNSCDGSDNSGWFPTGKNDSPGWRLDVVTLLAVIGESSMAEHSQAITASFLCLLPRIIPAPQALLKGIRPGRMPEYTAKMTGVYSGVTLDSVGFFANIIHPLDTFKPFAFKVLEVKHKDRNEAGDVTVPMSPTTQSSSSFGRWFARTPSGHEAMGRRGSRIPGPPQDAHDGAAGTSEKTPHHGDGTTSATPNANGKDKLPITTRRSTTLTTGASAGFDVERGHGISDEEDNNNNSNSNNVDVEAAAARRRADPPPSYAGLTRRRTIQQKMTDFVANPTLANNKKRPAVPAALYSPVHILSVFSFLLTIGVLIAAGWYGDGPAILSVLLISAASSVVGYASWWSPVLMSRSHTNAVPKGDVVIRTREGAFILIRCTEEVSRELYTATEECKYYVGEKYYRALMGVGTVLLMISVVLLGNCSWNLQVFIGTSYIVLNGLYWALGLLPKELFWDLGRYEWHDVTPPDAQNADDTTDPSDQREGTKSFTRTLWYAIRETKRTGWVERSGAAPSTPQWKEWLSEAESAAKEGNRRWPAVRIKDDIMKASQDDNAAAQIDEAEQHAPLLEVQPRTNSNRFNAGTL